jgi:tannase/feruloyl esterase
MIRRALSRVGMSLALMCIGLTMPAPAAAGTDTTTQTAATAIAPIVDCQALPESMDFARLQDAPTEINSASVVAASGDAPEFCDVKATIAPQIRVELKLPTHTWQGRYLQQGCGGYCGSITSPTFPSCDLQPGGDFATAATDDGHSGAGVWALNDQQLRNDYGFRAVHVVSIADKAIIKAFYGVGPQHTYFNGCSDGGREAMDEAERYPDDFDGIVAGALEIYAAELNVEMHAWDTQVNTDANGNSILGPNKVGALHAAVISACDGADGLVDGQIDDPRACQFDPGTIECAGGTDTPACLTPAQVDAARKIYQGPTDPQGERLYPGAIPYGSELAWSGFDVANSGAQPAIADIGNTYLRFQAFGIGELGPKLPDWKFTREAFDSLRAQSGVEDALYTDLSKFRDRGGKLIIYHGWADQGIPPMGTVAYYAALQERMGGLDATRKFARLFMIPTMYHCRGGYGPTQFDLINPIVHWVERDEAPTKVIVSGTDPQDANATRNRPVFAYPERAMYVGSGSVDDANNFTSVMPSTPPDDHVDWVGADLYNRPPSP